MQHSRDRHRMVSSTSTLTPVSLVSCLANGVRGRGCLFPMVHRNTRCGASPRLLASAFRSPASIAPGACPGPTAGVSAIREEGSGQTPNAPEPTIRPWESAAVGCESGSSANARQTHAALRHDPRRHFLALRPHTIEPVLRQSRLHVSLTSVSARWRSDATVRSLPAALSLELTTSGSSGTRPTGASCSPAGRSLL